MIVSDGTIPLGDPVGSLRGLTREEIERQLRENFAPMLDIRLEQNILVLDLNGRRIIFDTGKGVVDLPGYRTGKLASSLAAAGVSPQSIDAVVLSHAHSDHCGGCLDSAGNSRFPNASFYMAQQDFDFWTDETKVPDHLSAWLHIARRQLIPHRDRMEFFRDGEEFLTGVTALAAPGHTVGHTIFLLESGSDKLCLIADLAHHAVLLLERPLTEFVFDTEPVQAARSRARWLAWLADTRTRVLSYHFAWPGIGFIARFGDGFKFIPQAMDLEDE